MDDGRFDKLSRLAAGGGTRRGFLHVLCGVLAGVLTRFGLEEADAKKKKCKKNGAKCECLGGAVCKGKRCRCPEGTREVNGGCEEVSTCLGNGSICESSEECCSSFCTTEDVTVPTCCVQNGDSCETSGDCCANQANPAACENDRCCRGEGGTCATPNGVQIAECCAGLDCEVEMTFQCL